MKWLQLPAFLWNIPDVLFKHKKPVPNCGLGRLLLWSNNISQPVPSGIGRNTIGPKAVSQVWKYTTAVLKGSPCRQASSEKSHHRVHNHPSVTCGCPGIANTIETLKPQTPKWRTSLMTVGSTDPSICVTTYSVVNRNPNVEISLHMLNKSHKFVS